MKIIEKKLVSIPALTKKAQIVKMTSKHKIQLSVVHKNNRTHGLHGTPLYFVWAQLFQRCYNKKNKQYKHYGGRGITVCDQWKDFAVFNEWANSNGYQAGLTIDRENNDGIYEPENCRWVTQKVQCNNHRRNRIIEYNGKLKNLTQWCNELGLDYDRMFDRLYRQNWAIEKSFTTPIQDVRSKKSQYRKKQKAGFVTCFS